MLCEYGVANVKQINKYGLFLRFIPWAAALLCIFYTSLVSAQEDAQRTIRAQTELDSLSQVANGSGNKCDRAMAMVALTEILYYTKPDTVALLCQKAVDLIGETDDSVCLSVLAGAHNNLGIVEDDHGEILAALTNYEKCLEIHEKQNNLKGIATALSNLGYVYKNLEEYESCLEYNKRALEIRLQLKDERRIAKSLNNLGFVYHKIGQVDSCLHYYYRSLALRTKIGDKKGVAYSLNNIGVIYKDQKEYKKAFDYYQRSLSIDRDLKNEVGTINPFINLGELYFIGQKLDSARWYADTSFVLAQKYQIAEKIMNSAQLLYKITQAQKHYKEALDYQNLFHEMRDSINNEANHKAINRQQARHKYVEQKAHMEKELAIEHHHTEVQIVINYLIAGILIMAVAFLAFVFSRLKIANRRKRTIEEKNAEITASITYAKRLQDAMFNSEDTNKLSMLEHCILFRPKEIVSGDFYWIFQKQNHLYLAVADCTGHGIPGAFLTMIGNRILNEINLTIDLLNPSEILNRLRPEIANELTQGGIKEEDESKDGMDISLIRLNLESGELEWAGAMNPILLTLTKKSYESNKRIHPELTSLESSDTFNLIHLKGDAQPIGYMENPFPFTNHSLKLSKGDAFYLFTDGYADQFGGPNDRKFGLNNLRKLILQIQNDSMSDQQQKLELALEDWMKQGNHEPIDDLCLIGVRF